MQAIATLYLFIGVLPALKRALYPEVTSVVKQLQHLGFTGVDTNWAMQKPMVMQKLDWSFIAEKVKEEDNEVLMLSWRRKQLPSAGKKIILEDLLQFSSDEYLAARFGRENVRKDRFYFSETEVNRCSVLFPNTPNQVIFVWNDAELLKDIVQIMVGGTVRAESMQGYEGTIDQHKWILQNGISTQVRLEQLQKSLDQDIFFFGRKHDFYLSLTPESAKLMGLENGTLVFECINSAGAKLLDQEKISARAAIDAGLKLHVSLIVLWPAE